MNLYNSNVGREQVLWTCTGRNKTFPTSTSLPVLDDIAGDNTASLDEWFHSSETWARWAEGFHDEIIGSVFDLERNGLHQVVLCPRVTMRETSNRTIQDRSPPALARTAPSTLHQDGGVKHATGASSKIRGRDNITIGAWSTRTLRAAGKLQEPTHEMDRYRWIILGQCEMRWNIFGKTTTGEGHMVSFSGKEEKHEHGVELLIHEVILNTVTGCRPVSSRLVTIRLRAAPFYITVVQVYNQTSDYDDNGNRRWTFLLCKESGMQK